MKFICGYGIAQARAQKAKDGAAGICFESQRGWPAATAQEIAGDTDYDYQFDAAHGGWKLMAGIRPVSTLGVESDYIDFGNPSAGLTLAGPGGLTQADAKALALFGIGYLPLPVPFLDVYGKFGFARLHTTTTEVGPVPYCPGVVGLCGPTTSGISDWSTNFAYGAGVRGKNRYARHSRGV